MFLIVGLGNPGSRYQGTRHNAGFMVVDRLAQRVGCGFRRSARHSLVGRASTQTHSLVLAKPQTFMNLSGMAVAELLAANDLQPAELLVVYDEFALPFGKIRIRRQGSAGGHNGMRSIISTIGTSEFPRLRIGIGPDHPVEDVASYVLSPFNRSQAKILPEIVETSADALQTILESGLDEAMATFN